MSKESHLDEESICSFIKEKQKVFLWILRDCIANKHSISYTADIDKQMISIYKNAKISRQYFSKLCKMECPTKQAVIRLGFSLKLPKTEMFQLLQNSGYFFGINSISDLVFLWCIENEFYDMQKITVLLKKLKTQDRNFH